MYNTLIQNLCNTSIYPHPINTFELVETHLSWILLTGIFAYKIKKPVKFPFVDFSTLEKRLYYCTQEISLNKTLAEPLYLEVVPIYGTYNSPSFTNTNNTIIEYAVKMRQFDQNQVLNNLILNNGCDFNTMKQLAIKIARYHQKSPSIFQQELKIINIIQANYTDNFSTILQTTPTNINLIKKIEIWSNACFYKIKNHINKRQLDGYIKSCHGDLHLNNIVNFNDILLIFDCIEFNEEFRNIDTANDIAFLYMDLYNKNQPLAYAFINYYLINTHDYELLSLLKFYAVYRAMVRAKVALLNNHKSDIFLEYCNLALKFIDPPKPFLIIMHGLSGSGKSTVSFALAANLHAIYAASDVERLELAKIQNTNELYTAAMDMATYERLYHVAEATLTANYPIIIDATFIKAQNRLQFMKLAKKYNVPFYIINCKVSQTILEERIKNRTAKPDQFSQLISTEILTKQTAILENLSSLELAVTIDCNTEEAINIEHLAKIIKQKILLT